MSDDFPRTPTDHMMGFIGLMCILMLDVMFVALTEPAVAAMGRPLWLIIPLVILITSPAVVFVVYWWGPDPEQR